LLAVFLGGVFPVVSRGVFLAASLAAKAAFLALFLAVLVAQSSLVIIL